MKTDCVEPQKERKHGPGVLIAYVALSLLLCGGTLEAVFIATPIGVTTLLSAILLVGSVIVLSWMGLIHAERITANSLLLPCSLGVLGLILGSQGLLILPYFLGEYARDMNEVIHSIEDRFGLYKIWISFALVLFLLLRSGSVRKIGWKFMLVFMVVMMGWSVTLVWFFMHNPPSALDYVSPMFSHFALMWLRRLAVLLFVIRAGTEQIGGIRVLLFPLLVLILYVLICLILVVVLHWGAHGSVYAESLACLLALLIIGKRKQKKRKEQENVLYQMR